MVKIKTDTKLVDLQNKTIKEGDTVITVGLLFGNILSGQVSNPVRGYQLAKKFALDKEVELNAEDIVYIKEQVNNRKDLTALITGQLIEILEG